MKLAVVDSSVALKWFYTLDECGIPEAHAVLRQHLDGETALVAPSLMSVEVANALRWKRKLIEDEVVEQIDDLAIIDVTLFDATHERLTAATRLAHRHELSLYDALFLALAEELHCPLITADRRAFANIDTPCEIRLI